MVDSKPNTSDITLNVKGLHSVKLNRLTEEKSNRESKVWKECFHAPINISFLIPSLEAAVVDSFLCTFSDLLCIQIVFTFSLKHMHKWVHVTYTVRQPFFTHTHVYMYACMYVCRHVYACTYPHRHVSVHTCIYLNFKFHKTIFILAAPGLLSSWSVQLSISGF